MEMETSGVVNLILQARISTSKESKFPFAHAKKEKTALAIRTQKKPQLSFSLLLKSYNNNLLKQPLFITDKKDGQ